MKQYNVFPECNVDTNLVGYLLGGYPKHKSSCNEVVKAVNGTDQFAIGIIDADKRSATMDEGFVEYKLDEGVDGINRHVAMYTHGDGKRYLFTVKPELPRVSTLWRPVTALLWRHSRKRPSAFKPPQTLNYADCLP